MLFEATGLIIAGLQLFFAFIVVLSLPTAARRGSASAGTLFVILALATVI